jgi:hypothetical protein
MKVLAIWGQRIGAMILLGLMGCSGRELSSQPVNANAALTSSGWPARFAIYYGYPSLVNKAKDLPEAVASFAPYQLVVWGDGVEFDDQQPLRQPHGVGRQEHHRARQILQLLKQSPHKTVVYGYVALGDTQQLSVATICQRIDLWAAMGVKGIFLDEAGYDFGVTRQRQRQVLDYIHQQGLQAIVNAFDPDDLFSARPVPLNARGGGNPTGLTSGIMPNDGYLLESFQVREGKRQDTLLDARLTRAVVACRAAQVKLYVTTTTLPTHPFEAQSLQYAWWSAVLIGAQGFCWGEANYSSTDNLLPWRAHPTATIGELTTGLVSTATTIYRNTTQGRILLDRQQLRADFQPTISSTSIP